MREIHALIFTHVLIISQYPRCIFWISRLRCRWIQSAQHQPELISSIEIGDVKNICAVRWFLNKRVLRDHKKVQRVCMSHHQSCDDPHYHHHSNAPVPSFVAHASTIPRVSVKQPKKTTRCIKVNALQLSWENIHVKTPNLLSSFGSVWLSYSLIVGYAFCAVDQLSSYILLSEAFCTRAHTHIIHFRLIVLFSYIHIKMWCT